MAWAKLFAKTIKFVRKHWKTIIKVGKGIQKLAPKVVDWWNGKKIAIIGPTAAGKNCLYCRLKGESIPTQHIQTKGLEKVDNFTFETKLGDGRTFKLKCKGALNVGGEKDERERNWFEACKGAAVIFYIVDVRKIKTSTFSNRTRVCCDMKWLATKMGELRENTLVHILLNKMDLESGKDGDLDKKLAKLQPKLDEFEKMAKSVFGAYSARLTGITPTSMKDHHMFAVSFPKSLEAVYKAVHN